MRYVGLEPTLSVKKELLYASKYIIRKEQVYRLWFKRLRDGNTSILIVIFEERGREDFLQLAINSFTDYFSW